MKRSLRRELSGPYALVPPSLRLACLSMAVCTACAGPASEPREYGHRALDVVGGQPSTDDQNSVVLLVRDGFESWGTGVVVAPTLIMTSRHFLYEEQFGKRGRLLCPEQGSAPVLSAYDPATVDVFVGSAVPLPPLAARGVAIHSGNELDLCKNDVALLEVDTPLPVPPLPVRLDEPPSVGEEAVLVGWGATLEDLQEPTFPRLTDARQQRNITILAVGPTLYTPPGSTERRLVEASFMGTEGSCVADSGAPLLSRATGAVIGIENATQNIDPTVGLAAKDVRIRCVGAFSVYQRLDIQRGWLRDAFRAVGSAPWLEGAQQPAPFGSRCTSEDDCLSGICVTASQTSFCSEPCDRGLCPDGAECVESDSRRVCSIRDIAGSANDGRCTLTRYDERRDMRTLVGWLSVACCSALRRLARSRAGNPSV